MIFSHPFTQPPFLHMGLDNIEQHVTAVVDLWRVLTGWIEVKLHAKVLFWEAFWKKSAKQARDNSPIIYELFCLEIRFSVNARSNRLLSFTTSIRRNLWPNPLHARATQTVSFASSIQTGMHFLLFVSIVLFIGISINGGLYPCSKCRYLVHVNDLSHILKRGVRYLLYIVALHIRIDL